MIILWGLGTLGNYVKRELEYQKKDFKVITSDISDDSVVYDVLGLYPESTVINCTGVVKGLKLADSDYIRVNSFAPQLVSEVCDYYKSKLIHVSTDCVFKGNKGHYDEYDIPDATDIYGRSKALGEIDRKPHITVRTSFIGFGKRGLLNWLINQKDEVEGYNETYWNGVSGFVLARYLVNLVDSSFFGILHIGGTIVSKYYLLEQCVYKFGLNLKVVPVESPKEYKVNRSLITSKRYAVPFQVPSLNAMIDELANEYSRFHS